ncbi:unnamed protein product [marine sediment metagenome]|uniref:Uncharacterized protein n=1 Tax=marine sediment metagenome TaxID=412755 RepID=X1VS32_9ZZZZ
MNNLTIFIITGLLLISGCASTSIKPLDLIKRNKATVIKFEKPLYIPVPDDELQEVKDFILTGLFLFEHSRFEEATDYFMTASDGISDKESKLYKEAMMAAAVSSLI